MRVLTCVYRTFEQRYILVNITCKSHLKIECVTNGVSWFDWPVTFPFLCNWRNVFSIWWSALIWQCITPSTNDEVCNITPWELKAINFHFFDNHRGNIFFPLISHHSKILLEPFCTLNTKSYSLRQNWPILFQASFFFEGVKLFQFSEGKYLVKIRLFSCIKSNFFSTF